MNSEEQVWFKKIEEDKLKVLRSFRRSRENRVLGGAMGEGPGLGREGGPGSRVSTRSLIRRARKHTHAVLQNAAQGVCRIRGKIASKVFFFECIIFNDRAYALWGRQ